jgi:hypothetical protein
VLAAGAAAGTAYYKRNDLALGYGWATDHMKYIGNLWDEDAMRKRVEDVIDIEQDIGVIFRTCVSLSFRNSPFLTGAFGRLYTVLPPSPPNYPYPRTFIIVPPESSKSFSHFSPASNNVAPDELQAHTGMFSAKTNDGYYALGLETSKIIREAMNIGRGLVQDDEREAASEAVAEGAMSDKIETDLLQPSRVSEDGKELMDQGGETSKDPGTTTGV